jgi:hypothetical protein
MKGLLFIEGNPFLNLFIISITIMAKVNIILYNLRNKSLHIYQKFATDALIPYVFLFLENTCFIRLLDIDMIKLKAQ